MSTCLRSPLQFEVHHGSQDLDTIIKVAIDIFTKEPRFPALRVGVLNLLVNAVLYNPTLTLRIMDTKYHDLATTFFTKWFEAINTGNQGLPRVHDKRLSIVTLSSLLNMNAPDVPASFHSRWLAIVGAALTLFKELPAAVESKPQSSADLCPEVLMIIFIQSARRWSMLSSRMMKIAMPNSRISSSITER